MNSHQSEWRLEHNRLAVSRQHAEAELLSTLQQLTTSAYSQHFHSSHTAVHQLTRDASALLDERRLAEQSRDQWAAQLTAPRERARAMIAQVKSKTVKPERETRLMAAQRVDECAALRSSLQQLMHGLRHQCKVFGEELEQQRSRVEAELAEYDSAWLARMSDDRIEDDTNKPESLLAVDRRWLDTESRERGEAVGEARRQWRERWVERRSMMDRLFAHKREHAQQLLDERVAALKKFGGYNALLTEEQMEREAADAAHTAGAAASQPTTPSDLATAPRRSTKSALTANGRATRHPWNSCDQRLLFHILTQYSGAGKQRKQILERLVLEFKHVTSDELKLRLDCAIQLRLHSEQLRSIETDVRVARWELDEEVEGGWAAQVARLKDEWRRQDEAAQREVELAARHSDLQQLRAVRDEQDRVTAEEKKRVHRLQEEKEERRQEEERLRREGVKQQLVQYEEQQRAEQEKVQRLVAVEHKREEEEKEAESRMHAARVAARQQVDDNKRLEQQMDAARLEAEQRDKERRLEALRQSVAPHVDVDRERAQAPTASSAAERDVEGRLFRVDGWSDEAVFSDPRAKLSSALHAAGIATSGDYAREVIVSMGAGRQVRRDMQSSVRLSGDAAG